MKKKLLALLSLFCVLAMILPMGALALPADHYAEANSTISRNFTKNSYTYDQTNKLFPLFKDGFSVGSFKLSDGIGGYVSFSGIDTTHHIIAQKAGTQWGSGGMYLASFISDVPNIATVLDYAVCINYTAEKSGVVDLSLDHLIVNNTKGVSNSVTDWGVQVAIFLDDQVVLDWTEFSNTSTADYSTSSNTFTANATELAKYTKTGLTVQQGQRVTFALTRKTGLKNEVSYMSPRITYQSYYGETYSMADTFTGLQGSGGFYAGYSDKDNRAVYMLPSYDATTGFGGREGAGTIKADSLTVQKDRDTVILFRSPITATYTVSSNTFSTTAPVSCQVIAYNMDEAGKITDTEKAVRSTDFAAVSDIYLDRGDMVALRFSTEAEEGATVTFSPIFSSTNTLPVVSENGELFTQLAAGYALCPDAHINGIAANLTDAIDLQLYTYFDPSITGEKGLLIFPNHYTGDYTYQAKYAAPGTETGAGNHLHVIEVAAKEMADVYKVRTYYATDGGYVYGELREASVQKYMEGLCASYKDSNTNAGQALYKLAWAMLNYGAAAQEYFDYNLAALANAALKADPTLYGGEPAWGDLQATYAETTSDETNVTLSPDDVKFYGAALRLENRTMVRVCIQGKNMNGVTIEYKKENGNWETGLTPKISGLGNYVYYIDLPITVLDLRKDLSFRIVKNGQYSKVLHYNAEAYAYAQHREGNAAESATVDAMFHYVDASLAYAAASAQTNDYVQLPANTLLDMIRKDSIEANATYRVSDSLIFTEADSNITYDLKGATILLDAPVILNASSLTLKNATFSPCHADMTAIEMLKGRDVTLSGIQINGTAQYAISVDNDTKGLLLQDVTIGIETQKTISTGVRLAEGAREVYLTGSTIYAAGTGIHDTSKTGIYMKSNTITAGTIGVHMASSGSEVRKNTITATTAVKLAGATNILVAQNTVTGALLCENSDNAVFVKNTATGSALTANGNTHLYVVENQLNSLGLSSNNYLLADGNTKNAAALTATGSNTNQNGDNVTEVTKRATTGANEELLPHIDKDQFFGIARKETMRSENGDRSFADYIYDAIRAEEADIILAPGAYQTNSVLSFNGIADTTVYAYGVYMESTNTSSLVQLKGTSNFAFKGLSVGYTMDSNAQVYVLQKNSDTEFIVADAPGSTAKFGEGAYLLSGASYLGAQKPLAMYPYCDVTTNQGGQVTSNGTANNIPLKKLTLPTAYSNIAVGDILTLRDNQGGNAFQVNATTGTIFRDVTIFGRASVFTFVENSNLGAVTYDRVCITSKSAPSIDKTTYDNYTALAASYGITIEMAALGGQYRGTLPRLSSRDAIHGVNNVQGSQVTSCLFENLSDDATNQRHDGGKLTAASASGTTLTLTYTDIAANKRCADFAIGDRVLVYNYKGERLVDTTVDTTVVKTVTDKGDAKYTITVTLDNASTVASNLTTAIGEGTVVVDNMAKSSSGFHFDNCLLQNIRSRGLLIKSSNGTIEHVTFRNIGMAAVAIMYEQNWVESGISENVTVQNNLMDATGIFNDNTDIYAPITVRGLGESGLLTQWTTYDYLYKNITIAGNTIQNCNTKYDIYIQYANNVKIDGATVTLNDSNHEYKKNY